MQNLPSFEFLIMFCGVLGVAQKNANLLSIVILMVNQFYIVK